MAIQWTATETREVPCNLLVEYVTAEGELRRREATEADLRAAGWVPDRDGPDQTARAEGLEARCVELSRERDAALARAEKAEAALAAERAAANQTIAELHDKLTTAERKHAEATRQGDADWGKMLHERNAALARVAELEQENGEVVARVETAESAIARMRPVVDAARAYVHARAGAPWSCTGLGALCEAVAKLDEEKP
jgi:hypothetical protein